MKKIALLLISTLLFAFSAHSSKDRSAEIFKHIQNNDFKAMKELITSGIDANVREYSFNNTPLIEVGFKLEQDSDNYLQIAKMLLEEGGDPNLRNIFGSTTLSHAVKLHSNSYYVELIHNFGGDLNARYHNNNGTLLHALMENPNHGSIYILEYLLKNSDLINTTTTAGITPLMLAASHNCRHYEGCGFKTNEMRLLVINGAKINVEDKYFGFSALEFLIDSMNNAYSPDLSDLQFLLDRGIRVTEDSIKLAEKPAIRELLKKYLNKE